MANGLTIQPSAEQVDGIFERLIAGEHERAIERDVSREMPAAHREQLFAAVADRLRAAAKCDREVAVGFALEGFRSLYQQAKQVGDIAQARGAIKDWVTLALRHNVLGEAESEEEAGQDDEVSADDSRPGPPEKRRAIPSTKSPASRRANSAVPRSSTKKAARKG